ncbi:MAG: carbamoyl-phosphate synthase large subunit [Phycisphaerales bacterium]|nr:carbamoyl-phosphate synthase large subunit [Phycisphaerales bacterium]
MPKRTDIQSVFVIGAGPIIIGQACEFDYSGTQACKALKEEGYRVILVNSNPATIMTDPDIADATYIEPLSVEVLEKIIEKERPSALLPTVGGQTALNLGLELEKLGILKKYGVIMIGANSKAIEKAESRHLFNQAMLKIGLEVPKNKVVQSLATAKKFMQQVGLPLVIRPSLTLGGTGGGIAYTPVEFEHIVAYGLAMSPINEVLIDESLVGWKEFEMEVVRDKKDNAIIICSIENIDPMGVHTGDSITVAPALTLTDKEYQRMRDASIAVLREIGVETGGSNVQFAINPKDGRMVVIEMNPRVSRSSALASKVTGFPIAKIATKLAIGYSLDELVNDITKTTPASFEPSIDYVVVKIPRFAFEKFGIKNQELSTSMKSVGEVMAMGRSFAESLQKALRSLENGLTGLDEQIIPFVAPKATKQAKIKGLKKALSKQYPNRLLLIADALRLKIPVKEIIRLTQFDKWFVDQIANLVATEEYLKKNGLPKDKHGLFKLKNMGFSDARIAKLTKKKEEDIFKRRQILGIKPIYKTVDTCAAEFASSTAYLYSSYTLQNCSPELQQLQCEANPTKRKKVIIIGGGPNRIGQGIEFDYTCVHAVQTIREKNIEAIMINCNPETVSTDYDTADKLYFEPLSPEDVIAICLKEQEQGNLLGVIVQFGGQTPLKLAKHLVRHRITILGTSFDDMDIAEDRDRFSHLITQLQLKQAEHTIQHHVGAIKKGVDKLGFPVVIRPSNVLGGRAMAILHNQAELSSYLIENEAFILDGPILIDKFLEDAQELDVDAVRDIHGNVLVAGILGHVEKAGIHSGDSACCTPFDSSSKDIENKIIATTKLLANSLHVVGAINIQYAIYKDEIYIIEANPRASRTVPFISKALGYSVAKLATECILGEELSIKNNHRNNQFYAYKECVFPFMRFANVDLILGPEMKSTGEVMGIDKNKHLAFAKSQIAAFNFPKNNKIKKIIFILDKKNANRTLCINILKFLKNLQIEVYTIVENKQLLQEHGLNNIHVFKKPADIYDKNSIHKLIQSKDIEAAFIIGEDDYFTNSTKPLRLMIALSKIPYSTTLESTLSFLQAIEVLGETPISVKSLQGWNAML